ncbi:MAG TPA: alpha/beta hydrolase [Burkholderiales bacterium]|nr:alpha/beta hydrolase [Burkholderiales bacterium]
MAGFFPGFTRQRIAIGKVSLNVVHGGRGEPVLLLHGYPQTHVLWHKVAPAIAERFTVVAPDLRGYGDSDKPEAAADDHAVYCKRTTANDVVGLMDELGHQRWHVVGHDRGARVAHRMALDHPDRVRSFVSLDVVASQAAFDNMDAQLSYAWFHWHLMRQPYPLPETLIGNSARFYLDFLMERWCATAGAVTPEAYAEYARCFCQPETIRATCAEYRSVELDLLHDEADRGRKLQCPMLVLWGANTKKRPGWQTGKRLDMLATWKERASNVQGRGLDCGHFIPEEKPQELVNELLSFWKGS